MTTEQIEAIKARYTLMKTMKEHMCLTNEEYETTKKVRIYGMPTWLLHLIKVDIGGLLDALEAENSSLRVAKARCLALERALKSSMGINTACSYCVHYEDDVACKYVNECVDISCWQFDEERFGGSE